MVSPNLAEYLKYWLYCCSPKRGPPTPKRAETKQNEGQCAHACEALSCRGGQRRHAPHRVPPGRDGQHALAAVRRRQPVPGEVGRVQDERPPLAVRPGLAVVGRGRNPPTVKHGGVAGSGGGRHALDEGIMPLSGEGGGWPPPPRRGGRPPPHPCDTRKKKEDFRQPCGQGSSRDFQIFGGGNKILSLGLKNHNRVLALPFLFLPLLAKKKKQPQKGGL